MDKSSIRVNGCDSCCKYYFYAFLCQPREKRAKSRYPLKTDTCTTSKLEGSGTILAKDKFKLMMAVALMRLPPIDMAPARKYPSDGQPQK